MRTKLNKMACIALFFFLTGAMVFAVGSRQQPAASAGGRQTLQIALQPSNNVTDYKDNYFTRYMENLHNVDLEFFMLPTSTGDARTRLSLLAAANDLPEVFMNNILTPVQRMDYGSNGALVELNRYFSNPAATPNFNRIPQDDRNRMLADTRSFNGSNSAFPKYRPETWNMTANRRYINREWLAKLGLQVPTTTDELRNVLIAFRDRDPNGNGLRDEIGIFGRFATNNDNPIVNLINAFEYYNPGEHLAVDPTGRNIIAPFTQPTFRRGLQYLNGLYREGLLDASTFTVDANTWRAVLNAQPMVVGFTCFQSNGNFPDANNNPNYKALVPTLPPLKGPEGVAWHIYGAYSATADSYITNKAKNVDLAVRFLDSFYDPTISTINRFGEEGVHWTRDPAMLARYSNAAVDLGIYPRLSLLQLQNIWGTPQNVHWTETGPRYASVEQGETVGDVLYNPNLPSAPDGGLNLLYNYPAHPQYTLPVNLSSSYNEADGIAVAQLFTDIGDTYLWQTIPEFVIGTRDPNSDAAWNAYLRELDNMGLQRWISLVQAAYNRQR
jgi:putative aldouronate transport system substrate-binding protein